MRISIVSSFFLPVPPVAGGAMEKIWFRLARVFAARGHEVTHVSRRWPAFPDQETIEGVRMLRVRGYSHTRSLPVNLTLDFLWARRVARALPVGDIVVCNTVSLPAYLSRIHHRAGRIVAVLGRMPKGHARLYGRVDRIVATSQAVRAKALLENPRLAGRTRVFPNPIDWTLHQQPRLDAPALTIGYVGRMNPEKGLELLLQAAVRLAGQSALPAWRLRLIGPQSVAEGGGGESYIESLRRLAANIAARVSIEPPIYDAAQLAREYAQMAIFCYPSLAEKGEGLSVAPLEAMAAGAVPVVSNLDCHADVIRPGENGFTFDHRSADRVEQLAGRLAELLADGRRREQCAACARQDARRFDYSAVADALLDDFAELQSQTIR